MEGTISEIRYFGPSWAPRNWMICDGSVLPISAYAAFFSLIGTEYGGDGRTTFAIPDLRGRVAVGQGNGPGLSVRQIGSKGGQEQVTLTEALMPSHTHEVAFSGTARIPVNIQAGDEDQSSPAAGVLSNTGSDQYASSPTPNAIYSGSPIPVTGNVTVNSIGGDRPHDNMQPWLAVTPIICATGIFPSRS
jgi:microcystin-dependent protein